MKKTRTLAAQTRLDPIDMCVLVETYPFTNAEDKTISSVMRFYLESSAESLVRLGAARPLTIEDAIQRIESAGFRLAQLDSTNPESKRTRRAIEKERMAEALTGLNIKATKEPSKEEALMNELAKNVSQALGE